MNGIPFNDAIVLKVFGKMFIDVLLTPVRLTMVENFWNLLLLGKFEYPCLRYTKLLLDFFCGVELCDGFALRFESLGVVGICKHGINITSSNKGEATCDF